MDLLEVGKAMRQIEDYVNQVYRHAKGNDKEIQELKMEMKNHLLETVQDLQAEGKSEGLAIQIAKERFGEVHELRAIVNQMFQRQKNFGKWVLSIGAGLLLITALLSIFLIISGNNQTVEQADIAYGISEILGNDTELTAEKETAIDNLIQQVDYIHEARLYSDNPSSVPLYEAAKEHGFLPSLFLSTYSYGTDDNFVVLDVVETRIIGLLFLAMGLTGFVILFSIWFTIKRYHSKRKIDR